MGGWNSGGVLSLLFEASRTNNRRKVAADRFKYKYKDKHKYKYKKGQSQKTYTEKTISNTKNTSNIRKNANNLRTTKIQIQKNTKTNLKTITKTTQKC